MAKMVGVCYRGMLRFRRDTNGAEAMRFREEQRAVKGRQQDEDDKG